VLLEGTGREELAAGAAGAEGAAEVTSYRASEVVVRVRAPAAGFVVLADTHYPGWRAHVDGVETPLLRANYSMRAVRTPGGEHEVRFRYAPRLLWAGVGVSLATALVVALLLFRGPRRPRASAPPAGSGPSSPAGPGPGRRGDVRRRSVGE
jgi:hypothetical protein